MRDKEGPLSPRNRETYVEERETHAARVRSRALMNARLNHISVNDAYLFRQLRDLRGDDALGAIPPHSLFETGTELDALNVVHFRT
jgi:hypothetical protein